MRFLSPADRSSLRFAACGLWLLFAGVVWAQRSPFNGLEVLPADSTGHYRILIGGHFHGESTNRSGYPASTLLANLDNLNRLGAHLFLSTGDLFMDPVNDGPRYQRSFFGKLNMPLFNAPGNHDTAKGSTSSEPVDRVGCDLAVLTFNTEVAEGTFSATDLERLRAVTPCARSLFIVSHRPIWAEDDPQYSGLFKNNTRSVTGTNFRKDVYPILERIAEHTHVYWISGSMGGSAPSSIFFQEHAKNITYIQCAIRDEPRDALLIADVYPDSVRWSALSLTGQKLMTPEEYDAAWWADRLGKSGDINWRLLPYLVKSTVLHKAFWWGILVALLLVFVVRRVLRR